MNCRKFESQLERFLNKELPPASMLKCRAHLESCSNCRELLKLASRKPIRMESAQTEALVQAVLEKTSGKSCTHSQQRLPDYVDGVLAAEPRELTGQHLEHCHTCRQIYKTLRMLKEELPSLAQIDPGDSFTRECMVSLSRLQSRTALSKLWPGRIWRRFLARPRLAWESAYVLTLLFFIFFKLFAFVPGLDRVEALQTVRAKSAQVGVSVADTIGQNIYEWRLSLAENQIRWAEASSKRKTEFLSAIALMADKTKHYSQSTSNSIIKFPHLVWTGIVDKMEKMLPGDGPEA